MQTLNPKDLVSPRIIALKQELESGNLAALDSFWLKVTEEGTPLIESIPNDDHHALVTFLWRAEAAVDHVVFYSELLRGMWWNNWADALLNRLLQTNLFYRTYRVRTDIRFVYWLSPDHPVIHPKEVKDWDEYIAHCQVDPFNPNKFIQDKDRSFVEMPAAAGRNYGIHSIQIYRTDKSNILPGIVNYSTMIGSYGSTLHTITALKTDHILYLYYLMGIVSREMFLPQQSLII